MVQPASSIPSMDAASLWHPVSHSACALTLFLQSLMVPAALTSSCQCMPVMPATLTNHHGHGASAYPRSTSNQSRSWCHRSPYCRMPLHRHRSRRCHQIHHHRDCDSLPQQTINPSAAWLFKAMLYKHGFLVHGPALCQFGTAADSLVHPQFLCRGHCAPLPLLSSLTSNTFLEASLRHPSGRSRDEDFGESTPPVEHRSSSQMTMHLMQGKSHVSLKCFKSICVLDPFSSYMAVRPLS